MRNKVWLKITDKDYSYGEYLIEKLGLLEASNKSNHSKVKVVDLDSSFLHYLIKEIILSGFYRGHFIKYWTADGNKCLVLILNATKYNLIDHNWNERVYYMVRERCELDHALSWLSTLGGAFSALGDYFPNCADTAGKISYHQLKLALRLGDPNIAARCRLYLSLSLIQKKKFRFAQKLIRDEYLNATKAVIIDQRLLNMCKGIWSKLQYEYSVLRKYKHNLNNKLRMLVLE